MRFTGHVLAAAIAWSAAAAPTPLHLLRLLGPPSLEPSPTAEARLAAGLADTVWARLADATRTKIPLQAALGTLVPNDIPMGVGVADQLAADVAAADDDVTAAVGRRSAPITPGASPFRGFFGLAFFFGLLACASAAAAAHAAGAAFGGAPIAHAAFGAAAQAAWIFPGGSVLLLIIWYVPPCHVPNVQLVGLTDGRVIALAGTLGLSSSG
jgi:hypothetical protein